VKHRRIRMSGRMSVSGLCVVASVVCVGLALAGGSSASSISLTSTVKAKALASRATSAASRTRTIGVIDPDMSFNDDGYAALQLTALRAAMRIVGGKWVIDKVADVPYTDQLTNTALQLFAHGASAVLDANSGGPLFYKACSEMLNKTVNFAYEEPPLYYLEGVAAGMLTKTGTLGFVGSFPQGYSGDLNAFALGCQSVRRSCKVRNIYIDSFNNPPAAEEAAKTLVSAGADVVTSDLDDPSGIKSAAAAGAWVFGMFFDQSSLVAPGRWVTGTNYTPTVTADLTRYLREIAAGTFKGGSPSRFYGTTSRLDSSLQPWGKSVPARVREKVDALLTKMRSGWSPFRGPIRDTAGKIRVAKGQTLDPRGNFVYQNWTWIVQGITGG
jgi:basic membrane protein A